MWWQYFLVFLGALLFDLVPFPFPPAYTIMTFLQIIFDLNIWWVIILGVVGSIMGRYLLLLYAPYLANRYLNSDKNKDIQLLGEKMRESKWKGQMMVFLYALLPLPTTPLFLGAGISKLNPLYIIPAFFIGRLITNTFALHVGVYAKETIDTIIHNTFSWQSIMSIILSFILLFALFFVDWRALIQKKKLVIDFKIFK